MALQFRTKLLMPFLYSSPYAILEAHGCLICMCCGHPEGDGWKKVVQGANDAILRCQRRCRIDESHRIHRRGNYPTLGYGISFGGGRVVPGWIDNSESNQAALAELMKDESIVRLMGFSDGKPPFTPGFFCH